MSELLPCPFCGCEDLEIDHARTYDVHHPDVYQVHCVECGARGGEGWTEAEAIAAWNTRAERTCGECNITSDFKCSRCGHQYPKRNCEVYTAVDGAQAWKSLDRWALDCDKPNYCPNCGACVKN